MSLGYAQGEAHIRPLNFPAFSPSVINNGNVMSWAATGAQTFSRTYTYDELNRLQSMAAPGDACSGLSWTYDIWGNRTNQSGSGGPCSEHHPTVTTNNRMAELGYDAAGNVTSDPAAVASYSYDAENRMVTSNSTLGNATYVYDADGKRVEKTVDGVVSEFVYDAGGAVVAERQAGAWTKGYVMAGGMLALYDNTANPPTTYFAHTDHLGSTRLLTRLDGTVAECDDYLPFGELNAGTCLPPAGTSTTTHKFTGKERDAESGLDYFGARYYSSAFGRYLSPDWSAAPSPVPYADFTNPQTLNLYTYVANNPLNSTDPDGHCPDLMSCATQVAVGTAQGTWNFVKNTVVGTLQFAAASDFETRTDGGRACHQRRPGLFREGCIRCCQCRSRPRRRRCHGHRHRSRPHRWLGCIGEGRFDQNSFWRSG